MEKHIRILLGLLLAAALLAFGAIAWRAHQLRPRDIPILMYHNVLPGDNLSVWQVSEEEFAWQMDQLDRAGYKTILPEDIARASKGWGWLPRKPVVITFDDGYEGVMKYAEPILKRHGMKAICYVIVARLGGEGEERASFDSGPLLSTNEVAAMSSRGVVAIGSHSMTHCSGNPQQLAREIGMTRPELRRLTGIKTHSYCYPYGLHGYDYMYAALNAAHFHTALICGDEMFHYGMDTNLLAIPRLSVYGGLHDIAIRSVDVSSGQVVLSNAGLRLPLRVVVRNVETGKEWASSLKDVGGTGPTVYELPSEAFAATCIIEAWDKAGLFCYLSSEFKP